MDRFSFLGSAHLAYIDDLYQQYQQYPDKIEPSWRAFFQGYDFALETYGEDEVTTLTKTPETVAGAPATEGSEHFIKEFQVIDLINAYRARGHLFTATNPVRERRKYTPTLDVENFGLTSSDLDTKFQAAKEIRMDAPATLREIIAHLKRVYCQSIGVEYTHIRNPQVVNWIKDWLHQNENQPTLDLDQKKRILHKLNEAVSFESFLNTKFVGQKRFSIEGAESLIPALDSAVCRAADKGVKEFVVGMAHRGRLNVLTNIFGKPRKQIFSEFEGKAFADAGFDGDVKYHLGYTTVAETPSGEKVRLCLAPNPSHLEAVAPVVQGIARARINNWHEAVRKNVMPIIIHGDAAIAGQGIVYEVAQMESLKGYGTGGSLHIVINNQVGFTTNYEDARSSIYCTDVAKVTLSPVLHVNGDDVEAVVHAIHFAIDFRQEFGKDVYIDLLCYRKYGHNEGDEPRFTQPKLYKLISKHPNPREIYNKKLMEGGVIEKGLVKEMEVEFKQMLENDYDESKKIEKNKITAFLEEDWKDFRESQLEDFVSSPDTSFDIEKLRTIAKAITTLPDDKKFFNKIKRLLADRNDMVFERNSLDWGMAELLAYGSLVLEQFNVRVSGEDVERGTFSHRHAVIKTEDSEEMFILLNNITAEQGRFSIYNSLLSEYAVLGFDYGYALAAPETLTIWEAQFGDFANGAQIMIDQFISAGEDKWRVQNGLVMLLPHGYEGQGAEHSSARLERFLQLCAQENMYVVNATTPANFFHLLRRQMHLAFRKPLVVMSPKSLLRHPKVVSPLEDLASGKFLEVIDDAAANPKAVKRLVFCSGKLYYELLAKREELGDTETALVRIEQLYPLPVAQIENILSKYSKATSKVWAQEEPANMGAWTYILWQFPERLELVSSPASASPASGSNQAAVARQRQTVENVFKTTVK
ncbi:MAG: 2-oxoglutarate dehydrogenase E1 component [Schleiferiaceae bacterium]|nr:2-oxoglutarate dehydrogenase E1 component [Schleiferiaceae bacterium]